MNFIINVKGQLGLIKLLNKSIKTQHIDGNEK